MSNMNKHIDVKSIKTSMIMEGLENPDNFVGYVGTLKMKVQKVEKRRSSFAKKKELETVLIGLAKFEHANGSEYRAKVTFLPEHIVSEVQAGEFIEFPIHRIESKNSPNGYTFVSETIVPEEEWDF